MGKKSRKPKKGEHLGKALIKSKKHSKKKAYEYLMSHGVE